MSYYLPCLLTRSCWGFCRSSWWIDSRWYSHSLGALRILGWSFLNTILSLSNFTLNLLVNAGVTLKIFTLKSGVYDVSVHVTWYHLPSIFWYTFQLPRSDPVIVFLFPVLTTVFTFLEFDIFFRLFTICGVYPESETKKISISLLIVLLLHACASSPKKSSLWYISSVTLAFSFSFSL